MIDPMIAFPKSDIDKKNPSWADRTKTSIGQGEMHQPKDWWYTRQSHKLFSITGPVQVKKGTTNDWFDLHPITIYGLLGLYLG